MEASPGKHASVEGGQSQLLIKVRDLKKYNFESLHVLSKGLSGPSNDLEQAFNFLGILHSEEVGSYKLHIHAVGGRCWNHVNVPLKRKDGNILTSRASSLL